MLDLRYVRDNPEVVKANCANRRVEADIDGLLALAAQKQKTTTELQELQRQQNETASAMKKVKDAGERTALIERGKQLKLQAAEIEKQLRQLDADAETGLKGIPNLTHPDAPQGPNSTDRVVREVGQKPRFDFKPLDHVALCDKHRLADFEAAAKVTGSDFYFLRGQGALLQMALVQYAMRTLVEAGFEPIITPDLARASILEGTGYIPRGPETQIYSVNDGDLCLIATAEITLAGMMADEIIEAEKLPVRLAGLSHCFRTEAGAGGRATRGLYRVHQFTKVEMFAFCVPEQSEDLHQQMLALEEKIFAGLEVPYRVLDIAAGDLGGPAYRKYDLEAWMPGRGEAGEYGEVTSTSNCTDYQARRLNIRFKTAGQKGTRFVHMLNGTAVAAGRAIIAVLENHQQPDGSIRVPQALVPFMGAERIG